MDGRNRRGWLRASVVITPHFPSPYSCDPSFFSFFAERSTDPWMTNHPASRMLSESIEWVMCVYVCTGSHLFDFWSAGNPSYRQNQLANRASHVSVSRQLLQTRANCYFIQFKFADGKRMRLVVTIWIRERESASSNHRNQRREEAVVQKSDMSVSLFPPGELFSLLCVFAVELLLLWTKGTAVAAGA